MKDWIPEREFKKADFTYNAKKNVSEKIQSNAKIVKPYQFPRIEELNAKKNPSKQLQNTSIPKETPPGAKKKRSRSTKRNDGTFSKIKPASFCRHPKKMVLEKKRTNQQKDFCYLTKP
jgi:hypothetical protein